MVPVRFGHIMVNMRHRGIEDIEDIAYRPPEGQEGEVEVYTVRDLLRRAAPGLFLRPQRMGFHQLLIVEQGSTLHTVDFTAHQLGAGSVLWIRPGQVQQWSDPTQIEGTVLIFPAGLLDLATDALTSADSPEGPHHWASEEVDPARLVDLRTTISRLAADPTMPPVVRRTAMRHALSILLLHLVSWHRAHQDAAEVPEAFRDFRALVERRFAAWHDVAQYARALGWSPRTIARATRDARDATPKQIIDGRLLLEARRLLVQTDHPVHRIGTQLGFEDPSNFTAWFRRRDGRAPSEFRASGAVRGTQLAR